MKTRNVVIGLLILVVLVTAAFVIKKSLTKKSLSVPAIPSIETKIEKSFGGIVIPDDVEKAELKNVDDGEGVGIATRTEILANLPDLNQGQSYQVWLEKDGKQVLLGKMRIAKGGWILEYDSSKYLGYNKIIATLGDKHILEGSF
jgi:hypothetical protein